jgi:nucleotide-binding universal stress UspA family protein
MIKRIVVGVDGSANSTDALAWAVTLAQNVEAEVVAVHAVGLLEASTAHDEAQRAARRRQFETQWCSPLTGTDVERTLLLADGDPVSVVLRTARDVDADLIVVGSRGTGGRSELLLGSTSTQVTQRSPVPVVVVPAVSARGAAPST